MGQKLGSNKGYGQIASNFPSCKIIVIIEEKIVSKEDLSNESYQEGEVTYVDQGELLIV